MTSQVDDWINNGSANSENFFIDDDARAGAPNSVNIGVGGVFTFNLICEAPFTVTVLNAGKSKVLPRFVKAMNATPPSSVADCLTRATKEYLKVADDLDEEACEEDGEDYTGDGDDGDLLDQMNAQANSAEAQERRRKQQQMEEEMNRIKNLYDVSSLPKPCIERILSDYGRVKEGKHFGWSAEPKGRDLSTWEIDLFDFEKGTDLEKDMDKVKSRTGKKAVEMTMQFPKEYPFKPPFIRVVRPRFQFRTGRVTVGGSICTQLLTDDGWKPVYDVESIIETIRQQVTDPESGAKIDHSNTSDYTESEARDAFQRVAAYHKEHGW